MRRQQQSEKVAKVHKSCAFPALCRNAKDCLLTPSQQERYAVAARRSIIFPRCVGRMSRNCLRRGTVSSIGADANEGKEQFTADGVRPGACLSRRTERRICRQECMRGRGIFQSAFGFSRVSGSEIPSTTGPTRARLNVISDAAKLTEAKANESARPCGPVAGDCPCRSIGGSGGGMGGAEIASYA